MAMLLSIILAWITVVGTYGQLINIITAKLGTDTILPFTLAAVPTHSPCHLYTSYAQYAFALMDNFTSIYPKLTITKHSKRKWNVLITNVSKEDRNEYFIGYGRFDSWSNRLFLQTIDESSFKYNETVLVQDRSNYILNTVLAYGTYFYVIRFNGTVWTAWRYYQHPLNLDNLNDKTVLNTRNVKTNDEGIYHFLETYLQFHNQVDGNNTHGSEGQIITLSCEILGSYDVEALYIETYGQKVVFGNPGTISYSFLAKRIDHLSTYTCKAKIINYPDVIGIDTLLVINYPPSVEVKLSKDKKRLDCLTQGYPAKYTYYWTIFFNFSNTIENVTGLSNGTLFLQKDTDNLLKPVMYICYASNGIRDENGQLYHKHEILFSDTLMSETYIYGLSLGDYTIIASIILLLYIIMSHIVCCCCCQRKKKIYTNDIAQLNEYDEIGTVNYQSIAIPPLLSQRPISDDSVSVQFGDVRQAVAGIEHIDQINHNSQRTSYDDNFNVGGQFGSKNLPGNGLQNSINNSSDEDIESISVQVFENDMISYRSKSSGDTSNAEAEGTHNQPPAGNEYEHMYTQALAADEDKHKYSDRLTAYVNSDVSQNVIIKKKEPYINLRVWKS